MLLLNLHRSAFAVLLPDMARATGLTASQAGVAHAAHLAAYLLGQVPGGRLADALGGPQTLLGGLAVWSAATALTAAAAATATTGSGSGSGGGGGALAVILASRVAVGLASACAMPCVSATCVRWVPADQRSSTIGFVYALFNLGGVVGLAVVPLVADLLGGGGAFVAAGAAGVCWAAFGALRVRRLSAAAAAAAAGEAEEEAAAAAAAPAAAPAGTTSDWRQLDAASWRQLLLLCYAHATIGVGFFLMQSWLPAYVASLGAQGLATTGRLAATPWLAAAVVGLGAGSAADALVATYGLPRLLVRRLFQGASFAGCALSAGALALLPEPGLGAAVFFLSSFNACYALSYGGFAAYLQDIAGPKGCAGAVQGLTNSCSVAAGLLTSLGAGVAVDAAGGSWRGVFAAVGALQLLAAAAWVTLTTGRELQ